MLKIIVDHNFNHIIIRQLRRRIPDLDFVTALAAGLSRVDDKSLLRWAASDGRVVLTHDRHSIPGYYADLVNAGEITAGILLVPDWISIGEAVDELEIQIVCGDHDHWVDQLRIL